MSPSDSERGKRPDENQPRPRNKLMSLGLRPTGREPVDYKDVETLRQFISDRGKIRPRRATGLTPQQQRQVATAIRNAREMALLPCESRR
ncbi:30S ribosomal protein S18 [Gordonia sp. DT30]|uniref:30S ribosomal protein S18 n=1 Tax=Gordonia sp. DT30 TaxID=3416546 RepID=UPI003CEFFBA7